MERPRPLRAAAGAALIGAVLMMASCGPGSDRVPQGGSGSDLGRMVLELAIGEGVVDDARYEFASISSVLEGADGTLWVADGAELGLTAQLRQFDPQGRFIRQVGRAGAGPGEYLTPSGLALLKDGRVALRDFGAPGRITVYKPDGSLDAVWTLGARFWWTHRARDPIQVDTGGVVWIPVRGEVRPSPDRKPPFFLRVSPSGEVLDTVQLPEVPEVERLQLRITRTLPSGGVSIRGVAVPFQPSGQWAWAPTGAFAIGRTDLYRIRLVDPTQTDSTADDSRVSEQGRGVFSRDLEPVPVGQEERAAAERRIREELAQLEGGEGLRVPELPTTKPMFRTMGFAADGKLMVLVSMPSVPRDGAWTEPLAYDVFDKQLGFVGRLLVPDSLIAGGQLFRLAGTRVWTIHVDPNGVESVRRYRIIWP